MKKSGKSTTNMSNDMPNNAYEGDPNIKVNLNKDGQGPYDFKNAIVFEEDLSQAQYDAYQEWLAEKEKLDEEGPAKEVGGLALEGAGVNTDSARINPADQVSADLNDMYAAEQLDPDHQSIFGE